MHRIPTLLVAAALIGFATGCAGTRPDDYPVITAHHPDGTGGGITGQAPGDAPNGYVLEYAAGDEVVISLQLESDVLALEAPASTTVALKQPIRVAVGSGGMLVSIDGGAWEPPLRAFKGSLTSGLSITPDDLVNRGTIDITANRR